MTMNMKMLRVVCAGMVGIAVAATVVTSGGQPGAASGCQRTVAIDPQVTVSEAGRNLTFVVHTGGCAAAGAVEFTVTEGTAQRRVDFLLQDGRLQWGAGDTSSRRITATVLNDAHIEDAFEYFRVTLVNPSSEVRIASAVGTGRIFDDDGGSQLATVDSRICLVAWTGGKAGCASPQERAMSTRDIGVETIEPGHIISVPVVMNSPNSSDQLATFDTSDGTLLAGLHYEPVHDTVNIPAGAVVVFVQVRLLPPAFTQNGQHFNVHVSNYTGGGVVSGTGQVTVWS